MNATPDPYRPFFNRRLAPELRQLILEGHRLLDEAATGRELHRFARPLGSTYPAGKTPADPGVPRWTAWQSRAA